MARRKRRILAPLAAGALVYLYARDSGGAGQQHSVADQLAALHAWAEQRGFVVAGVYRDEARPGSSAEHREAFLQMVSDAQTGRPAPAAVVVWDGSRFARNADDAAYFRSLLRRAGVDVVSVSDNIPDGPLARFAEMFVDLSAEHYLEALRFHTRRGHLRRLAAGFLCVGKPALGYLPERVEVGRRRDGQPEYATRVHVDPDLAPRIVRAFELRAAGASYREIEDACQFGFGAAGWAQLLRSPVYRGALRYGGQEYPDVYPAIVTPELWQRVQDAVRERPAKPWAAASPWLLSGLLQCAAGHAMYGQHCTNRQGRDYPRYRCRVVTEHGRAACHAPSGQVRCALVDEAVVAAVLEDLSDPARLAAVVDRLRERSAAAAAASRLEQVRRSIADGQAAVKRLVALVDAGALATAEALTRLAERQRELARLQEEERTILSHTPRLLLADDATVRAYYAAFAAQLHSGEIPVMRQALRALLERVVWHGRQAGVTLHYRPPP